MNIWLTTDTHFGHTILQEYCGRPTNVDELILKHLLLNVKPSDLLIHLGDICIGKDAEQHEKFIKPIPGKKWLMRGNHDGKSNQWYLEHGWDFVGDQVSDTYFGKKVLLSHKPVVWDGEYEMNVHGHFHNSDHRRQEPELLKIKNGYQKLLALEYTNYRPVQLKDFINFKPVI